MKHLEAIIAANEAENVGDKLGEFNGNSVALAGRYAVGFWQNRTNLAASRKPWDEPVPLPGWEHPEYQDYMAFAARIAEEDEHFSPALEKRIVL